MKATHVYIGTLPCGCNISAAVDITDNPKWTGQSVKEMIDSGCSVARVPLTDLHSGSVSIAGCVHTPQQGTLPL